MTNATDERTPEDSVSIDADCSTDDRPLCCDDVDASIIDRWFDYWVVQDQTSNCHRKWNTKEDMINKLRRLALAGASKARSNNKAVAAVLADVLESMARDLRSGNGKIQ